MFHTNTFTILVILQFTNSVCPRPPTLCMVGESVWNVPQLPLLDHVTDSLDSAWDCGFMKGCRPGRASDPHDQIQRGLGVRRVSCPPCKCVQEPASSTEHWQPEFSLASRSVDITHMTEPSVQHSAPWSWVWASDHMVTGTQPEMP